MKTILFVSPTGTLDNGAEISILNLMKFLVRNGYKVINIAPISSLSDVKDNYLATFKENGIECILIKSQRWWWSEAPARLFGTKEDRAASYRETIKIVADVIKEKDVDIVISNTINVFQGAVAAKICGRPHFWLIHEFPMDEFAYYIDKIDFIDDYSQKIFSVRGQLENKVSTLFPNRMIDSFIPYTQIQAVHTIAGKKKRIVSVGRMTERKNQLELIKAVQQLNNKELEIIFIGGWDDSYKKRCDEYIRRNKIKNIRFLGNQENPWSQLTDQDICVFPSVMETFGLVYVEALLNGIPVIMSDNPGYKSAYQLFHFGRMYPSGNQQRLVSTIEYLLENFEEEKQKSVHFVPQAQNIYQESTAYQSIIDAIENSEEVSNDSLRHLEDLLMLNENKSKLARLETKVRQLLQRVFYKIFRR